MDMPKVGDYVIIEGTKVGAVRREGNLVGIVGSLLKVQWIDGTESVISPGAGAIKIEAANSKGSSKKAPAAKKPAKKKPGGKKR